MQRVNIGLEGGRHCLVVVTPVKYECGLNSLTCTFARSKNFRNFLNSDVTWAWLFVHQLVQENIKAPYQPVWGESTGDIETYYFFFFPSFLNTDMAQVIENPPSWKPRTYLSYTVNTMAADALAPCVARASAAMVLTQPSHHIPVKPPVTQIHRFFTYGMFTPMRFCTQVASLLTTTLSCFLHSICGW